MKNTLAFLLLSFIAVPSVNALTIHCEEIATSPYSYTMTNDAPHLNPDDSELFLFQVLKGEKVISQWASRYTSAENASSVVYIFSGQLSDTGLRASFKNESNQGEGFLIKGIVNNVELGVKLICTKI
jgi:hypothetical protein